MKAVVKNGVIEPQEALPEDWREGTELLVEKTASAAALPDTDRLEQWFTELEAGCSQMDPEDDQILREALDDDPSAALRLALEEYIQYAKRKRLKELSDQVEMRDIETK